MYERKQEPLVPFSRFVLRSLRNFLLALVLIVVSLWVGMLGYHFFENMPWTDAFANAAMILSGMGPLAPLQTGAGKLFAGLYALFSGLAFVVIIGVVFSPVLHRILHKFHLMDSKK